MHSQKNARLILLNTCIGAFLAPFTSSAISFAVPQIGEAFRITFYQVIWIPLSFLIALASLYLISGRLSDEFGRVKLYRTGLALYCAGMILSVFSPSILLLMIFLFIGGAGAALSGSNSVAIISQVYEKSVRGRAIGINVMSVYLGLTLAPVASGFIVHILDWRYLFVVTVPIAILAIILTFTFMNGIDEPKRVLKVDVRGAILFTVGLFLTVYYLSAGNIYGWLKEVFFLAFGLILLGIFFYVERGSKNPLIDARLFTKNRTFLASNITAFLIYISTFSIVFVFSLYMQLVLDYNPLISGLVLISEPLVMVIFSPISGLLSDRFGSRSIATLGMIIIGLSFMILYFLPLKGYYSMIIPLGIIGVGFGLFSASNTSSVINSVSSKQYGLASGTLGTMRFTGQLLSISLSSLILASSLPRTVIIGMFSGISFTSLTEYSSLFVSGFKNVMLVSGILSLIGSYISFLRKKGK